MIGGTGPETPGPLPFYPGRRQTTLGENIMAVRSPPLPLSEEELLRAHADAYRLDVPCPGPQCGQTGKYVLRKPVMNDEITCYYCEIPIDIGGEDWRFKLSKFVKELGEVEFEEKGEPF